MNIYFIVKPIKSSLRKRLLSAIEATLGREKYSYQIMDSLKKGHAVELTEKAIAGNASLIVACGGDGTINEVARGLVNSRIPLGIIPLGSGNGIARHFKIPFQLDKAMALIKKHQSSKMDVGVMNGQYFFGNMGCAFESHFIKHYQKKGWHGLGAYFIAFFMTILNFRHQKIKIEYNQQLQLISPFLFLISNTNQQGYNLTLTPDAKTDDGQLDLFFMDNSNGIRKLKFMIFTLFRKKWKTPEITRALFSEMKITKGVEENFCVQLDGEYTPILNKTIEIKVLPKKLNVILPD